MAEGHTGTSRWDEPTVPVPSPPRASHRRTLTHAPPTISLVEAGADRDCLAAYLAASPVECTLNAHGGGCAPNRCPNRCPKGMPIALPPIPTHTPPPSACPPAHSALSQPVASLATVSQSAQPHTRTRAHSYTAPRSSSLGLLSTSRGAQHSASLEVTRGRRASAYSQPPEAPNTAPHSRSPEVTRGHPRSPEVTRGHQRRSSSGDEDSMTPSPGCMSA